MKFKEYLSFFRWPNLVIIVLSMIFMHRLVILPLLHIPEAMPAGYFLLLLSAVLSITAAGYVINDYFDIDTDYVNKPGRNKVGSLISENSALNLFYVLSAFGIISGAVLSWMVNEINFTLIFLFTAGILWYYSQRYKCMPVTGNLVVSFLSALSFGLVWLFDFFALKNNPVMFTKAQNGFAIVSKIVFIYMIFAFLSSFFRELIKDMEDMEGDKTVGCRTFAVVKGIKKSKYLASAAGIILLLLLIWSQIFFYRLGFYLLFGYFLIMDAFLLLMLYKLKESADIVDFYNLSDMAKIFMFLGILSMPVIFFETVF